MDAKPLDRLVSTFSGAPAGQHYEAFREEICRSFCRLDGEPSVGGELDCGINITQLGSLAVAIPGGTSARFARTRELLSDACDDLVLVIATAGQTQVTQKDASVELAPSQMYMAEMSAKGVATLAGENRFTTVRIPRRAVLEVCPGAEDRLARPLLENPPLREVIARYTALATETAAGLDPAAQRLAAQHLIDLVALLLGTSRDEAELATGRGYAVARLRMIEADIVGHLADDDLTIVSTARRQGLGAKTVQRMFERAGKTFTAFVRDQRLKRASQLLATPGNHHRKIAELAFAVGFGDLSYFNRAFRRSYGMTPSEWRALPHSLPA